MKKHATKELLKLVRKTSDYQTARLLYQGPSNSMSNVKVVDFGGRSILDRAIALAANKLAEIDCSSLSQVDRDDCDAKSKRTAKSP